MGFLEEMRCHDPGHAAADHRHPLPVCPVVRLIHIGSEGEVDDESAELFFWEPGGKRIGSGPVGLKLGLTLEFCFQHGNA